MVEVTARLKAIWHEGRIAFLGNVGDCNLHIAIGAAGPEYRKKVEGCVYEPLRGIGGSVSAEHGIGLEKKAWFLITRNAQERSLMLDIKRMLDPKGILNPGQHIRCCAGVRHKPWRAEPARVARRALQWRCWP